jgi:hypothetical protein
VAAISYPEGSAEELILSEAMFRWISLAVAFSRYLSAVCLFPGLPDEGKRESLLSAEEGSIFSWPLTQEVRWKWILGSSKKRRARYSRACVE